MEDPREQRATRVKKDFRTESYLTQSKNIWPGRGQIIIAQFDNDSIVVYQAYKREIAQYAALHKKFEGCDAFNKTRMTWIKPGFLWMMYRSKWASKSNQDHVLAIWLKRSAFETYLENAREHGSARGFHGTVRMQWDPDHLPNGEPHPYRRALQLGLRDVTTYVNGTDILDIQDISEIVREHSPLKKKGGKKPKSAAADDVQVSSERVYIPSSKAAIAAIEMTPQRSEEAADDD